MGDLMTILPAAIGLSSGIAGLANNFISSFIRRQGTKPNVQPGTGQDVTAGLRDLTAFRDNPQSDNLMGVLNELAKYSPMAAGYSGQLVENERAANVKRGLYDELIRDAESSGFDKRADEARARGTATEGRRDDLTGRVRALTDESTGYFRNIRDNPNIYSDEDITRMAAKFTESELGQQRRDTVMREEGAARLGIPISALEAMNTIAEQASRGRASAYTRDLEITNALQSAQREFDANTMMGELGFKGLGLEGDIDTRFTTVAEDQYGRGDLLDEAYLNRVSAAKDKRAAIEQPENLFLIGQILDQVNRFNTAERSGAWAQNSEALTGMYDSMMSMLNAQLDRQAMADMMPSSSDTLLQSTLGGLTGSFSSMLGGGLGYGTLSKLGVPLPA